MSGQRIDEVFVDRPGAWRESKRSVYFRSEARHHHATVKAKPPTGVEPIIGHLKAMDCWVEIISKARSVIMNVLLCAGHNLRLILKRLRFFCSIFGDFWAPNAVGRGQIVHHGVNSGARWLQSRSTNAFATQLLPTTG